MASKSIMSPKELLLERVKSRCRDDGGCWHWPGACTGDGSPSMSFMGKVVSIRRELLKHVRGIDPGKNFARDTCNNPRCLNPDHLVVMTRSATSKEIAEQRPASYRIRGAKISATLRKRYGQRLSDEALADIRMSGDPTPVLAERYGVMRQVIGDIRAGRRMKDYSNPFLYELSPRPAR
jgi:hypothetical protein